MKAVTIDSSSDRFIISIDKSLVDKEVILRFLENLRLEFLAQKVDFGEDIEKLGDEIKADWWANNKGSFIPKEVQ